MTEFQENAWTEERKDGQKDGRTLFHRTLPATARGPIRFQTSNINLVCIFYYFPPFHYFFEFVKEKIW